MINRGDKIFEHVRMLENGVRSLLTTEKMLSEIVSETDDEERDKKLVNAMKYVSERRKEIEEDDSE